MILGIGTDIVHVRRFDAWAFFSPQKLSRVFTDKELIDCYSNSSQSYIPEKLAARFAAKEAFFKAFSAMLVKLGKIKKSFGFLTACRYISVEKGVWEVPVVLVDWLFFQELIGDIIPPVEVSISFSHESDYAVSFVIISDIQSLPSR